MYYKIGSIFWILLVWLVAEPSTLGIEDTLSVGIFKIILIIIPLIIYWTDYLGGAIREKGLRDYFLAHWKGELSLPRTYWIDSILAGPILIVLYQIILKIGGENVYSLLLALLLILTPGKIWLLVGTWRAANNYNNSKFWKILAKIWVIISGVGVLLNIIRACGSMFLL